MLIWLRICACKLLNIEMPMALTSDQAAYAVLGPIGDTPFDQLGLYCISSLAEPGTGQNKAGHWLGLPID